MFDQDHTTENQHSHPCQKCDTGGVFCDGQSGDWICENCGHNYTRPERSDHAPEVIKTLGRQTGIGASFVQRKLGLHYCAAVRLLEKAKEAGVIVTDGAPYAFKLTDD